MRLTGDSDLRQAYPCLLAPPHETSPLASIYASYLLEPPPGKPRPMIQVVDFEKKLGVLAFPVEAGRVLVSMGANAGYQNMPKTHDDMLGLLQSLPVPDAYRALKDFRPLTPLAHSRFTARVRRNFDALDRLPEGIVAIGDAVASFNPIQGMTVAALEAEWLGRCLDTHDPSTDGFAKACYAGLKPIVDLAWAPPDLEAKRVNPKAQPWARASCSGTPNACRRWEAAARSFRARSPKCRTWSPRRQPSSNPRSSCACCSLKRARRTARA